MTAKARNIHFFAKLILLNDASPFDVSTY